MKIERAVPAALFLLAGCIGWDFSESPSQPDHPPRKWPKEWETPWLVGGGTGVLLTFDSDMGAAKG